jgi:tetratricopeptide (TPR) repeat protein
MRAAFLLAMLAACGPKKPPETVPVESEVVVVQKTLDELMSQAVALLGGDVEVAEAEQATSLMTEASERFPDEARTHYNLGVARWHSGDPAGAQRAFERAKGLDESLVEAWIQLGRAMAARDDFGSAVANYRDGVEQFPEHIEMRVALIDAYRSQGRAEEAVSEAQAALKVRADSVELYNSMGLAYLDMGRLGLARFVFQKAMSAVTGAEDNAYLACNLGRVYQLEGNTPLARAFYLRALELDPELLPAQVYLSEVYMKDRNYGGVVELLERTAEADPNNADVQLILGVAYRGVGRHSDAETAYRKAGELRPVDPDPWFNLGILFGDHVKDYEASLTAFQRYLDSGGSEAGRASEYMKEIERERTRAEKRKKAEEERKKREVEREERQRLLEQAEKEKAANELREAEAARASEASVTPGADEPNQPVSTEELSAPASEVWGGETNGGPPMTDLPAEDPPAEDPPAEDPPAEESLETISDPVPTEEGADEPDEPAGPWGSVGGDE